MDVSALFKGLQNLFEGSRFDVLPEDLQQFQRREIAYRDKEYCFHLLLSNYNYGEPPSIKDTDQGIIINYLSKLTNDELNATDDNGVFSI